MKELNQVLSGNIIVNSKIGLITIRQPDATIRYLADFLSEQVYDEAFEDGAYIQEEMEDLIIYHGWWTEEDEDQLEQIPKDLEQMKLDYFNNFLRKNVDVIKKAIKRKEGQFEDLQSSKYQFLNYTCESLKSQAYLMEIIKRCSYYKGAKLTEFTGVSLNHLYSKYNAAQLTDNELRELSKLSEWKMTWNASKNGIPLFLFPACDMTNAQKTLVSWSRMYDSVFESMDCPTYKIIEDDYALDGWFIQQRKKREDEQKESGKDNLPKTAEVFVPSAGKEDNKRINDMNTGQGKGIIRSRFKELKNKGSLQEQEFSHVKQGLAMKANQALFEKGKK
jgi:hypothetical protein